MVSYLITACLQLASEFSWGGGGKREDSEILLPLHNGMVSG